MSEETIQYVTETWKAVESIGPEAMALFYQNLFTADPSLKPLFKGDMKEQEKKLLEMIGIAVSKLKDMKSLIHVLQALGKKHVGYGVQEAHYQTVGGALLKTLEQGLGDQFTPPVRDAWTSVYGAMAGVMIEAAKSVDVSAAA